MQTCSGLPTLHLIDGPRPGAAGHAEIYIQHRARPSRWPSRIIGCLDAHRIHDDKHAARLQRARHSLCKIMVLLVGEVMNELRGQNSIISAFLKLMIESIAGLMTNPWPLKPAAT